MSEMVCAHCGAINKIERKTRSAPQLRRYFGVNRALYRNWPEHHLVTGEPVEFAPESEEHLRKWLQVEAGYKKAINVEAASDSPADIARAIRNAEGLARALDDWAFARPVAGQLVVYTSKSIQYEKLGHKAFCELNNAVDEVIWAKTGHDPEQLLREYRRAA